MTQLKFKIDGKEIVAEAGQTILEAADASGVYIPRLCAEPRLEPHASCRVCMVKVNGRAQAACTQPVAEGAVVENNSPELLNVRRAMVEMLYVEGNHICPACERSGSCELQALAYRLGISSPRYPYRFPKRDVDATHEGIFIDHNRCILCARCVRASVDLDGKHVFDFVGRGAHKRIAVDAEAHLADTNVDTTDQAVEICPVGALLKKRVGFSTPFGRRKYDTHPIGADIESGSADNQGRP